MRRHARRHAPLETHACQSAAVAPPPERLLADVYLRAGLFRTEVAQALLARLAVAPEDHLLELGVGSGRLLSEVAARATRGHVVGVEPAPTMVRHAARRNARFVAEGRVSLHCGSSADLRAWPDARFDKVYGVHVTYFWREPERDLAQVARVLRPGGLLVLGYWPEEAAPPRTSVAELEARLRAAGLGRVQTERAAAGVGGEGVPLAWTCARR